MAQPSNSIPTPTPEPLPPSVYLPPIVRDPVPAVPVIPADPPIVNTFLPDPEVLEKLATPPVPKQISISGGKRGDPEPYIFGHCIADPILIAADDSGETLAMDMLWSVGEIDYFEGLLVDRVFEGRADMLGNMEHFEGTAGQAASTIMTALKGSYDTLANKAHSVLRWRSDYATLQIQGWVRGLLLVDPRASPQLVYSTNPALALARILVDCGYTMNWTSVGDAADYCDEVIGSPNVKRWEIGGQITRRAPAREWISALALYANCFVDRIGDEVYLIPDMPRSSNHTVTADDMILESVRISHAGGRDVPSAVTVYGQSFEVESLITGVYTSGPISYTYGTPDGAGSVAEIQMPFLQTVHACGRMAEQIYRKAHNDMTLEFIGFDDGLQRTIGDVGSITNAAFDLSAELMTLIENEQISRGRWRRKYVQYVASNYSDVIYTGTSNDTVISNPFSPGTGPTPTINWEDNASSPRHLILTLSWTGVTWAYIQDYYVQVYSATSPEVVIYDSAVDGYVDHAAGTITLDLSAFTVNFGETWTADIYIRSNVLAVGANPGTASIAIPDIITVEDIDPDDSALAALSWFSSDPDGFYTAWSGATGNGGEDGYVNVPGETISNGSHVVKYDVVSIASGSGAMEVNGVTGTAGQWYRCRSIDFGLWQTSQPSPLAAEDMTVDFTVADNDGASPHGPVAGTEKRFRARFVAYKGVSQYLVYDTFTGTKGTNLTAHTPNVQTTSPGGWTAHAGNFFIGPNSGQAHADGTARYVIDAGTANACAKLDVLPYSKNFGLIARAQDSSNYWLLIVDDSETADPVLNLIEVNAGVQTVRDSLALTGLGPIAFPSVSACYLRLMCNGNSIRGSYGHGLQIAHYSPRDVSYTSSSFNTETKFGIYGEGSGSPLVSGRISDFSISDIEAGLII